MLVNASFPTDCHDLHVFLPSVKFIGLAMSCRSSLFDMLTDLILYLFSDKDGGLELRRPWPTLPQM
jgi:hypothetical protein